MEELKNYICKNSKDRLIIGIAGAVFAIAGVVLLIQHHKIMGILFLAAGAVLFYETFTSAGREERMLQGLLKSGLAAEILPDFAAAYSFADDALRLGQHYIFRKKYSVLLKYEDIAEAGYFERYDTEDHRSECGIWLKLADGRRDTLCSLYGQDTFAEAQRILAVLQAHNSKMSVR